MKFAFLAALALTIVPLPASAQQAPDFSLEHRMLLRCSAAFALAAQGQADGDAGALAWPDLSVRGREFFVRASAQVMDEAGLGRAAIQSRLLDEAGEIVAAGTLAQVMQVCLPLLPPA